MQFFGGHQRKAVLQIEAHLMTEHRQSAGAGAVGFYRTFIKNSLQQVLELFHASPLLCLFCRRRLPVSHHQQDGTGDDHWHRQYLTHGQPVQRNKAQP